MTRKTSIEIGKNYIKIAEGNDKKRLWIDKFHEVESDEDFIKDDSKVEEELLYNLLGEGIVNNNFSKKNITIVLAGVANILIREMVIPFLSVEKTCSLLRFEARQNFPVNIDNFVIDYKQLSIFNEGKIKKQQILLVAVPKGLIESILNVSKKLGLKIKRIDIESNSLVRLVTRERDIRKENNNELFMIVNLMRYYVTTIIVNGKDLVLAKTFPIYDLERVFKADRNTTDLILNYYSYMINEVVENIVKFYDFYRMRAQETKNLSKIYLTGEVCTKIDIRDLLFSRINTEVEYLNQLEVIENRVFLEKEKLCSFVTTFSGLVLEKEGEK